MKKPAVVVHETPNIVMLAKPRARKLYGHEITDCTIKVKSYQRYDRRQDPHRHGMGRPYDQAVIGIFDDNELRRQFNTVLKGLVYREQTALSRALCVHYNTVLNWTKGKTFPGPATLILVVQWGKAGKPVEKKHPGVDDNRLAICPNMVSELTKYIHPNRPQNAMSLIEKLALSSIYKRKAGQPVKPPSPLSDLLHREATFNPFAEVPLNPWDDDGDI